MRCRFGVLASTVGLVVASFVGGVAVDQPTSAWALTRAALGEGPLPAWGSEPVPQYGSGRSEVHAISVLSDDQAWAVGVIGLSLDADAKPLVERWDGTSWSVVDVPHIAHAELFGVDAIAPDDVWMVGAFNNSNQSLALHWDGNAITRVATPSPGTGRNDLYAVTAVGPDDVWAVGDQLSTISDPLTLHWDGSQWQEVDSPKTSSYDDLYGVTAISADDVWAVGSLDYQTAALHWDGSTWTRVDVPVSGDGTLSAVAAKAADDVWAVGQDSQGSISVRWDGSAWTKVDVPQTGGTSRDDLSGVQVLGADDVWAVGTSYLAGNPGSLAWHWGGQGWKQAPTPQPRASTSQLEAASVTADGTVFAAGSLNRRASVLRLESGAFQKLAVEQVGKDANRLFGISADGPDDIWAVGSVGEFDPDALTLHYDGSSWKRVPAPAPPLGTQLEGVVTLGPSDAWAVGYTNPADVHRPVALHWDGTRWRSTKVPRPGGQSTQLLGVDAIGPDDVWAVGVYNVDVHPTTLIEHWDGTDWRIADSSTCQPLGGLSGVSFLSPSDGWAVGDASTCHWDGRSWNLVPSPQPSAYGAIDLPLHSVSGTSSDDVWAVGYFLYYEGEQGYKYVSLAEHWDGTSWQVADTNLSGWILDSVTAVSSGDVWAVGRDAFGPIIVRWNGAAWQDVPTPDRQDGSELQGVTSAGSGQLWDVGLGHSKQGRTSSIVQRAPSPTQGAVIGTSNVSDATVSYTGPTRGAVVTDVQGGWQVGGLPAGRYRFTLSFQACTPVSKKALVVAGTTLSLDLHLVCGS